MSVVIPFYNEEQSAAFVLDELRTTLDGVGLRYEVLAVVASMSVAASDHSVAAEYRALK